LSIRSSFDATVVSFFILFGSGTSASIAFESFWPEGIVDSGSWNEQANVSQPADDRFRPDLLVEQWLEGVGSIAEQEAASQINAWGIDPWAEAFAESSRAAVLASRVPAYPVALNPQV